VPGRDRGTVGAVGAACERFRLGDRAGMRGCATRAAGDGGDEWIGRRVVGTTVQSFGGVADYALAGVNGVFEAPPEFDDVHAAPLLCAGIVGYRALKRAALPPGGRLGIYGFGASAHLVAQVALAQGASVHVLTRSEAAQEHARELGVTSVGPGDGVPPEKLDSAILFAPAGGIVPRALEALDRGGVLSLAGIYLTEVPPLDYERDLFQERELRSVTSNTRGDGDEFLRLAANIGVHVRTTTYPLDRADAALRDLAHDRLAGAAVLVPG
jgi:propanol-preferring alcohol dehydrogenase